MVCYQTVSDLCARTAALVELTAGLIFSAAASAPTALPTFTVALLALVFSSLILSAASASCTFFVFDSAIVYILGAWMVKPGVIVGPV